MWPFGKRKKKKERSFPKDDVERMTLISELESERNMCIDDIETIMHAISVETGSSRHRATRKKEK